MGSGMRKKVYSDIIGPVFRCIFLFFTIAVSSACPTADISGDCVVDISDFLIFAETWLSDDLPQHPGLVAHWGLNESTGETAADFTGGHPGLLHGDPQWMPTEGYLQGALFFDGVDDYIQIPAFKGITGTASRTCAAWINTTQISGEILSWGEWVSGGKWIVRVNETGSLRAEVEGGNIYGTTPVNDGSWHHVAVVLEDDGSPDISEARLYVDGQQETIAGVLARAVNTSLSQDVRIGVFHVAPRYFRGHIDDVQIFNQALTTEEILRLYQMNTAVRHSPDFTGDNKVDTQDIIPLSRQWLWEEPAVVISEFLASNNASNPPDISKGQIRDGNGESSDWIEIYNQTDSPINLGGWGLTDKQSAPLQWQFPAGTTLQGRSYLVVFASGKNNYPYVDSLGYLHTNFKLSASGEYLVLTRPDGSVQHGFDSVLNTDTGEYGFPDQKDNISYGMLNNGEYYFSLPTPGQPNCQSFLGFVNDPQFSHERGFYESSFSLTLTTSTSGAVIRYTTDGTDPTLSNGITYAAPIAINTSTSSIGRYIRAAAFKAGYQPSPIKTKTYLMNATTAMKGLPAVCLSGSASQVFYNPNGIMAISGGAWGGSGWYKINASDYNNVIGHGMDFERPVSMEYLRFADGMELQEDCGIRVHGSAWMRPRYTLPSINGTWSGTNKYSFRLYFRSVYGDSKFRHPILEKFPEVEKMDTFVLRAGHNDQTNPFVRDEMIRRLQYRMGHQASRGTFVNLYVNGSYKGYYNLCERIDEGYCQQWFNSDKEWDVVGWVQPDNVLEIKDGDAIAFNAFINYAQTNNLTNPLYYAEVERQMDMTGFADYIIAQCWGGNWDWPQNNWTATSERSPERKWRFFVWDAEGAMDGNLDQNRFNVLNSDGTSLSRLYRAVKSNEDFRVLFADRLHKHFLETDGVMTKPNLTSLFQELAGEVQGVIPSISTYIPSSYIPNRENIFFNQCISQGLFTYAAPRVFLNGQEVKKEYALENSLLSFQNASGVTGDIYYTLDGTDPRLSLGARSTAVTLVPENAPKRVLVPTANIGTQWRSQITYNDTSWNDGLPADTSKTGGVGYERNPGEATSNVPYISYNVHDKMYNQYTSVYIRIPFTLNAQEIQNWNYLTLKMRYDDGFIAYINGVEVYRRGFSGTPAWNSTASSHENSTLETFVISNYLGTLQAGQNILAIQGMNESKTSSDFVVSAILEAGFNSNTQGVSSSAQKYTSPVALSKSDHIKARTLNGSQWGALREAAVSVGPINENLRITEFLYHPKGDPNEEFMELTNIGTTPLNLNKVGFTKGIRYTFGDTTLQPGQFLLLVQNQAVFENRYGTGLPIAGQFEGALDNAGEKLQLSDALGNPIQTVDYKDTWYEITDGDGFSLTAVDPAYEKTGISEANLEARWTFNESSGVTVYDTKGLRPGTIYNMQDTTRFLGREGKALNFDGVDDYIQILNYKGVTGTASRTCSAWIKTTQVSGEIISWGELSTGNKWLMRINETGSLRVEAQNGFIYGTTPVNDGSWHHVAVVLEDDGSPDISEARLYIDGQQDTVAEVLECAVNTLPAQDVRIGVFYVGNRYFQGYIDDVRIYSRAMSADEITAMAGSCWDRKELWHPSAIRGGTPGRYETAQEQLPLPGAIVINELLAHSHGGQPDWIELFNTTNQNIDIGGWVLSDSFSSDLDRMKYRIPAGVILTPSNPYYVIEEDRFNNASDPGCLIPFALSEGGETLYVQSSQAGQLTGYFTKESFGATETDVSLGRFQKSTGSWNFAPMSVKTNGAANAYPKVGPIIISEIMYNPGPNAGDQDYEYLELMNISDQSVRTANFVSTYSSPTSRVDEWIPWKFTDGIQFEFPVNLWIAPAQRILLVKNRTAFDARYPGVPAGTVIYQWTSGSLANEGETLQIAMAGDQEYQKDRYYIRQDRVVYEDKLPWPPQADGTGQSLTHLRPDALGNNYTNDPIHWTSGSPSPGW